jgi:iron complex outermembrane receptor protein
MTFSRQFTALMLASSALAFPSVAQAQEAPQAAADSGRGLEEIVVTARRSSERLINVPVAVTALSAAAIEKAHVSDLQQVAQLTPNLIIASASSGTGGSISLRGVGTSFLDPGLEQSVGLNADGVSIGRGHFLLAAQFDLKQIEVLKGPQALFFGKNSPAGVISITSADPTPDLTFSVRAGYEFEAKERSVEGYVAGPISETLGFRIAAKYSKLDGWLKNTAVAGPDLAHPGFTIPGPFFNTGPGTKQLIGRVTLKWQPTDDLTANFKFAYNKSTGNGAEAVESYCLPNTVAARRGTLDTTSFTLLFAGLPASVADPNSDCKLDRRVSRGQQPTAFLANWERAARKGGKGYSDLRTYIGSFNVQYETENLSFTSITGYTRIVTDTYSNASQDTFNTVASSPSETGHTWSEELRVASKYDGPLNFVAGGFFETSRRNNTYQPTLGFVGFDAANGGSTYTFTNIYRNRGKTYSAFGQLKWQIVEQVELSGGVRYTKESKKTQGVNTYVNSLGLNVLRLARAGQVLAADKKFSNWSPEITLRYKPSNNVMTYVAYKTGYKSGGISTPATLVSSYINDPSVLAFDPERSKGFEAGLKAELLDRTLRFDATVYRYTYSNLQLTSFDPNLVAYFIRNAGKARTTGFETSALWQATPEFSLNGGISYNRGKFVDFKNAQCYALISTPLTAPCTSKPLPAGGNQVSYDRSGQPLPRAPKWTLSGGFNYEREIGSNMKFGFGGDAVRTSSYITSEAGDPNTKQKAYWRLNANAKIGTADDKYTLAFYGRNLTNEYITVITNDKVLSTPGIVSSYSIRPREIGVELIAKF